HLHSDLLPFPTRRSSDLCMSRSNSGDSNLRRRIQRLCVFLGVVPLTFVSFCEGGAVRLTLENETNQTLYVSAFYEDCQQSPGNQDRKSTRLNSSHEWISY